MNRTPLSAVLAVVAGVLLVALAVLYAVEPAASLPSFLPGHVSATNAEHAHHHVKHAIAALAVAAVAFAYAWFSTGPAASRRARVARPS